MLQKRVKDSQKSKEDILFAAESEFSEKGIYGTRVDEIAAKANINKRMIYEYFGNKEELYKAVLVNVYSRLSRLEIILFTENLSSIDAIKKIIKLYFNFLRDNPTYVNLILWENLNKGRYIHDIDFSNIKDPTFEMLRKIIIKGKAEKIFRDAVDTEQFIISLLTYSFSYFSNRYTLSKLLAFEFDLDENIKKRIENVTEMFLKFLCLDNQI